MFRASFLAVAAGVAAIATSSCSGPITSYNDPLHHTKSAKVGPAGLEGYYSLPRTTLTVEIKAGQASESPQRATTPGGSGGGGGGGGAGGAGGGGGGGGGGGPAPAATAGATTVENITLTKQTEPDPYARLLYRFEPNSFSDDTLQIDTDEQGLLTSVSSDTFDRSGSIAVAIADLVFAIQTRGAVNPVTKTLFNEPLTPLKVTFDPTDPYESALASSALMQRGYCLLIGQQVRNVHRTLHATDRLVMASQIATEKQAPDFNKKTERAQQSIRDSYSALLNTCQTASTVPSYSVAAIEYANRNTGIYYRRPISTPVAIYKLQDKNNAYANLMQPSLLWAGNIPVFNKSELYRVDIDRSAFVRRQTNIKFANGNLTSIKLEKPSEVLAGIGVPVQILRIAFAIPLAGLQQDTTLNNAKTAQISAEANAEVARLNAQTAQITAMNNNLNARATLMKLQAQNAGGSLVLVPQ